MANPYIDTHLFDEAVAFAVKAHSNTERRGKGFPYILHPMEAATIVSTLTSDPEMLAAAVLHDTLEDTAVTYGQIEARFGKRVADLVLMESNVEENGVTHTMSWRERKQEALKRIAHSSKECKMVAMGDKLSNMRALAADYKSIGDNLWLRFHAPGGRSDIGWYYRGLLMALDDLHDTLPYQEFERLLEETFPKEDA